MSKNYIKGQINIAKRWRQIVLDRSKRVETLSKLRHGFSFLEFLHILSEEKNLLNGMLKNLEDELKSQVENE